MKAVDKRIDEGVLKWFGHVEKMGNNSIDFKTSYLIHSTKHPINVLKLSSDLPYKTKSSAYKKRGNLHSLPSFRNLTPILPISIFTFIPPSMYTLKGQGDMIQPCLTPLLILKHSLSSHFTITQAKLLTFILLIPFH